MVNWRFLRGLLAFFALGLTAPHETPALGIRECVLSILEIGSQVYSTLRNHLEGDLTATALEYNQFEVKRDFFDYSLYGGPGFDSKIDEINQTGGHWIDMGAGAAVAQRHYRRLGGRRLQMTAVVLRTPVNADPEFFKGREEASEFQFDNLRYLSGINLETWDPQSLPPADLITDVLGPITYSMTPDVVLRNYLQNLKVGGKLFITGALFFQTDAHGGDTFLEFLKLVEGIEVREAGGYTFEIRKVSEKIRIPRLELLYVQKIVPPRRVYRINRNQWF